jgi:hypothetical protein
MPRYEYQCPKCCRRLSRIVKLANRDIQVCGEPFVAADADSADAPDAPVMACDGDLVREEISETAMTPYSWRP